MAKTILIIGGGISGLSALHYVRRKYDARPDIHVQLLEQNPHLGGTIATIRKDGAVFEAGPNGFLDNKSSTLDLAQQIGLEPQLIRADPNARIRYLCSQDTLQALPSDFASFLKFPYLKYSQKLRVLGEVFVARGSDPQESIYQFGKRRVGEGFAKYFLDPMMSGIFAGDSRQLILKSVFPRLYHLEHDHGSLTMSLFKRMLAPIQEKKQRTMTTSQLWSFKNGMGQLIDELSTRYQDFIKTNIVVRSVRPHEQQGYSVQTTQGQFQADELIIAAPAYAACDLVTEMDLSLAAALRSIPYAAVSVVGFMFDKAMLPKLPVGFGYLRIPSEDKEVLGVLFSSQIFGHRAPDDKILLQIMIGGARYPQAALKTDAELYALAASELAATLKTTANPQATFLRRYPRAIPQYTLQHANAEETIREILPRYPGLHLLANYLNGVSVNDCTANAQRLVQGLNC